MTRNERTALITRLLDAGFSVDEDGIASKCILRAKRNGWKHGRHVETVIKTVDTWDGSTLRFRTRAAL